MEKKKLISVVIPVFNEEENIVHCYNSLCKIINEIPQYDFEFIFTDNHSTDRSFNLLLELASKDPRIRAFRFSRNFGYQRSIYTGYMKVQGDAAIAFDCDLQDPPELLPQFIAAWEQGNKVVYGIRRTRREGKIINITRKIFYRVINSLSEDYLPSDAGDFRLLDRCVLEQLRKIDDYQPYLRGIIASIGFQQLGISYDRQERKYGKSKFPLRAMFSLAIDGIISQSVFPLRIATYIGLSVSLFTFIGIVAYLIAHFFQNAVWPAGFTTVTVLILFSLSLNALFLGIIGEYIGRIYHQVKKRPFIIIEASNSHDIS
jgi:dolichol-phosphate mannosyltransferase